METLSKPIVLILLVLLATGCHQCDLVEAELRTQTQRVEESENLLLLREAEICSLQTIIADQRAQLEGMRPEAGDWRLEGRKEEVLQPPVSSLQPPASSLCRVTLGMLTGGRDLDGDSCHDAIQLVIQPRDEQDDIFGCAGSASVVLYELFPSGRSRPLAAWDIDQPILHQSWRSSLFGRGYQVVLSWDDPPSTEKVRCVVLFVTTDGQEFEIQRDFWVSLPGQVLPGQVKSSKVEPPHIFVPVTAEARNTQVPDVSQNEEWIPVTNSWSIVDDPTASSQKVRDPIGWRSRYPTFHPFSHVTESARLLRPISIE